MGEGAIQKRVRWLLLELRKQSAAARQAQHKTTPAPLTRFAAHAALVALGNLLDQAQAQADAACLFGLVKLVTIDLEVSIADIYDKVEFAVEAEVSE